MRCHRQRAYPGHPWWSRAHRVSVTGSQNGAVSWAVLPSLVPDVVGVWWEAGGHVALHSQCWVQVGRLRPVLADSGVGVDKGPATKKRHELSLLESPQN